MLSDKIPSGRYRKSRQEKIPLSNCISIESIFTWSINRRLMLRRKFVKDSGMLAFATCAFGNIHWSKDGFIGDSPTTTDILGPFYRPGAPLRTNLNPAAYKGELFHLVGTVYKEDGKTPFKNCLVEVWQCDENKVYDNNSDDYKYRGAQKTNAQGEYHFVTTHPVPYLTSASSETYRPAHIHMRLSGDGQQDLITQVYFKGDPYLEKDSNAASPEAINRILSITKNSNNQEQVQFDIVMAKEFKPEDAVFEKLSGIYRMSDNAHLEFYRDGDQLLLKRNGQIIAGSSYKGNNEFVNPNGTLKFELQPDGGVKVCWIKPDTAECALTGIKVFKYKS